jgi:hypothetical protein
MKKSNYLFALALGASTLTFAQVGIGTSTPSNPLDIEATDAAIDINNTAADGDPALNFQLSGTTTFSIGIDDGDSDKLKIGTTAPDASTRMTIDASGNVGIGTSSPATTLDVVNAASTDGSTLCRIMAANNRGIKILAPDPANGNSAFVLQTGNAWTFSVDAIQAFHISSNGTIVFPQYGAGTLTTNSSGVVSVSSDERLKDIQGDFNRGLSDIKNIQPISYKWKLDTGIDSTGTSYSGFSAQNVQANIPEAVGVDPKGYLTLSDRPILAALVNAVNEQQAIIDAQKKENESQKAEIESLKAEASNATSSSEENASEIEKLKAQLNALLQAQTATVTAVK